MIWYTTDHEGIPHFTWHCDFTLSYAQYIWEYCDGMMGIAWFTNPQGDGQGDTKKRILVEIQGALSKSNN
jgi:hypothetical protein